MLISSDGWTARTGQLFNEYLRDALSNEIPILLDIEDTELLWKFFNKLIKDINMLLLQSP